MMPNAKLTDNTIVNVTAMDKRLLEIKVGIAYEADLVRAKLILKELVEEEPRFLPDGRTFFVDSLDDSSVTVGFRAWTPTEDYIQLRWDMIERVKLKFDEERYRFHFHRWMFMCMGTCRTRNRHSFCFCKMQRKPCF